MNTRSFGWLTRRHFLEAAGLVAAGAAWASGRGSQGDNADASANAGVDYGKLTLPWGIRSRRVDNNNGLTMHILEAGFETPRPCVLLLHGFPELAYTWRNQLLPLSQAGFHAIAPDLRGYGLSAPKPVGFDDDLLPYLLSNRVVDVLGLTRALGHERVAAVIGHDWGAPTAQWCAMARPDVFQSVVSMSNPFYDSARLPLGTADKPHATRLDVDIQKALAALPRPRKHYVDYSATREANENMWHAPQGVHDLLRAMYWFKSANWPENKPFPLKSWTAAELAKLPTYYVMDLDKGIAETMATAMPSKEQIASCRWMTEADLEMYSTQYTRTGFQGGLNSYRILTDARYSTDQTIFAGRKIEIPALYIGGASDWGVRQSPGAFESMHEACSRLVGVHLVDGAGHSIPEEQPNAVNRLLIDFLTRNGRTYSSPN
jgi:pimeloyl-ACP methyl ester carboxylesterase